MQVADALCRYSFKPRKEQIPGFQPRSSVLLADQVYQEVTLAARQSYATYMGEVRAN